MAHLAVPVLLWTIITVYSVHIVSTELNLCEPLNINLTSYVHQTGPIVSSMALTHTVPLLIYKNHTIIQRHDVNITDMHVEKYMLDLVATTLDNIYTMLNSMYSTLILSFECGSNNLTVCRYHVVINDTIIDGKDFSFIRSSSVVLNMNIVVDIIQNNITKISNTWRSVCQRYNYPISSYHSFTYNSVTKTLVCVYNTTLPWLYMIQIKHDDHVSSTMSVNSSSTVYTIFTATLPYTNSDSMAVCTVRSPDGSEETLMREVHDTDAKLSNDDMLSRGRPIHVTQIPLLKEHGLTATNHTNSFNPKVWNNDTRQDNINESHMNSHYIGTLVGGVLAAILACGVIFTVILNKMLDIMCARYR
nr:membrane protein b146 [Mastomys natalensis cytomegalovirus 3]WEG69962.1 membrane protein b146 [Mastomys natalensis cytomegalovirus 3]WEG70102.1 membrane protein b146 [Mastomys natalensis cytomegalovirus 3]WEG70242.1 membrane protein b146 [Mastomys natalensis cytomegalovirus 3]WEG70382.1 membrane protein b146 [Mastomys natalensis cytomegalovirus 3]